MKTIFYKILYKGKEVVYVGVTTRNIGKRFKEHLASKALNPDYYSIVEFDHVDHPEITSIEVFYEERTKVVFLEKMYIREEKDKGSLLLNISPGGEWGAQVLNKIRKEVFLSTYGSFDNYKSYLKKKYKSKTWICSWVRVECRNKTSHWMRNWIYYRSLKKDGVKRWLGNWAYSDRISKSGRWLSNWISQRRKSKLKIWLSHWRSVRSETRVKTWLKNWYKNKSISRPKYWLRQWIKYRGMSKTKYWIKLWTYGKRKN